MVSGGLTLARDYHLSPDGDDGGPATLVRPWKSLERLSAVRLEPGDRVLLSTQGAFEGCLKLEPDSSGTQERPIIITSYGFGQATISAGNGSALVLKNSRNIEIRNLRLVGSGRKAGNTTSGLMADGVEGLVVDSVEVSGFQKSGIFIEGSNRVTVTRVHAHENGFAGISSGGKTSHEIYVGSCLAENNPGDPTNLTNHSGNGIVLGQVQDALIEYCEARYNGWDMPRKGNGPVGIWVWDVDRAVIQHNVSHHNRSTGTDGGGFDFDGGVTNSILQYNYSHDNHGSGYLICQFWGGPPFRDNIVRYNISQDDGITNHNAGIYIWVGGKDMESTDVHNNTVFNSKGSAVAFGVDSRYDGPMPRISFRNNIFVSGEEQIAGWIDTARFERNLYWAMGDGGFRVGQSANLDEWSRTTGQEVLDGKVVGIWADPLLKKNGTGLLTDPLALGTMEEYTLLPGSPAIDAGLDLGRFHLPESDRDFLGNPVPTGKALDIGACELLQLPQVAAEPGR